MRSKMDAKKPYYRYYDIKIDYGEHGSYRALWKIDIQNLPIRQWDIYCYEMRVINTNVLGWKNHVDFAAKKWVTCYPPKKKMDLDPEPYEDVNEAFEDYVEIHLEKMSLLLEIDESEIDYKGSCCNIMTHNDLKKFAGIIL